MSGCTWNCLELSRLYSTDSEIWPWVGDCRHPYCLLSSPCLCLLCTVLTLRYDHGLVTAGTLTVYCLAHVWLYHGLVTAGTLTVYCPAHVWLSNCHSHMSVYMTFVVRYRCNLRYLLVLQSTLFAPQWLWSAPRAKFHVYRSKNVGIEPP